MPPKYYCDYCDKQFHDTPASRKRHTQGVQHQRAKKLWFDSFKDSEIPNATVCSTLLRTGICHYGPNCKYFHPSHPSTTNWETNVLGPPLPPHGDGPVQAVFTLWRPLAGDVKPIPGTENNLPPSLQPPPDGGYPALPPVEWG